MCIAAGLAISVQRGLTTTIDHYIIAGAAAIIVYGLLAEIGDMYRNWHGVSEHREVVGTLICWGCTWMTLLLLAFVTARSAEFSRSSALSWLVVTPVLIVAARIITRWIQRLRRSLGYKRRKFAIVGVNELGFQLARNIEALPEMGLSLAGFFDDRPEERNPAIPADLGRRIGTIQDLVEQSKQGAIERIYITFPMRAETRIRGVLDQLSDTTASVYIVPDFFVFQLLYSRWTDISACRWSACSRARSTASTGWRSRFSTSSWACLFLLLAAVPMALIALGIRLTSPGPALFRQKRYGLDGREIRIWKFRTMNVCEDGAAGRSGKTERSARDLAGRHPPPDFARRIAAVVQRAGRRHVAGRAPPARLRAKRRVSLANRRLHAPSQGQAGHHRPGPGQRLARGTDSPEKMRKRIECDLYYIREWSLWLDVTILFRTILVVLSARNAY